MVYESLLFTPNAAFRCVLKEIIWRKAPKICPVLVQGIAVLLTWLVDGPCLGISHYFSIVLNAILNVSCIVLGTFILLQLSKVELSKLRQKITQ